MATTMAPAVATGEMAIGSEMKWGRTSAPIRPSAAPSTTAHRSEHRRLDQELATDHPGRRAEGLAQPDLADPLGDRDQHDVHHADPPHQQGDRGDPAEQHGEGLVDRGGGREELLLAGDGEVGLGGSGDLVEARAVRRRSPGRRRTGSTTRWPGSGSGSPSCGWQPPKRWVDAVVIGRIAWSSGLASGPTSRDEPTVLSTPITDIG